MDTKFSTRTSLSLIIKRMYTGIKSKLLGIEKADALFYSTSGVKQGDSLAPTLFLFAIQAAIETIHCKWSDMKLSQPQLQYYPNEPDSFLNKRSQKKGTCLDHKDTFYADGTAVILLTKEDLITGTTFVQKSFAQFRLEVHLRTRLLNAKSKTEAMYFPSHSNLKKEIPKELVDGSYDIPGGRFVAFLGTYLSQSLTAEDIDIDVFWKRLGKVSSKAFEFWGERYKSSTRYIITSVNSFLWYLFL